MIVDVIVGLSTFGGVLAVFIPISLAMNKEGAEQLAGIGLWFGLLVVMFSIVYVAYKIIHRNDK